MRDSIAFTITQPDSSEFTAIVSDVTCFDLNDGTISFTGSGGIEPLNYFYNGNSSLNNMVSGLSPNTYDVYIQDQNGCLSVNQSVTIAEPAALSLTISGTSASGLTSLDGIAEVAVTGGTLPYLITWNDPNSQTGEMAVYLNPGWYEATVMDDNGCSIIDSVYLGVLGIEDMLSENLFFYPNPAKDIIQFNEEVIDIEIYDLKGSLIHAKQPENGTINLSMASGVYTLVLLGKTSSKREKLIVVE